MELQQQIKGSHILLELVEAGTLIGTLDYIPVPPEIQIIDVLVNEHHRGKGYGSRLLQELMTIAQKEHITKIFLEVRASNQPALGLYKKFNFIETGRRKAYYQDPVEDAVMMIRNL